MDGQQSKPGHGIGRRVEGMDLDRSPVTTRLFARMVVYTCHRGWIGVCAGVRSIRLVGGDGWCSRFDQIEWWIAAAAAVVVVEWFPVDALRQRKPIAVITVLAYPAPGVDTPGTRHPG